MKKILEKQGVFFLLLFFVLFGFSVLPAFAAKEPNDPNIAGRWWWKAIGAGDAWELTTGSKKVKVAVIDTAIDIDHPDLQAQMWHNPKEKLNGIDDDDNGFVDDIEGWDFLENDNNPRPSLEDGEQRKAFHHGTLVAGIVGAAGNNKLAVSGINWEVSIIPLRALNDDGDGGVSAVNRAIEYAIRAGADIINLSLVTDVFDESLQKMISRAYHQGVLVVAAMGNDGKRGVLVTQNGVAVGQSLTFPPCFDAESAYSFVLGVGAVTPLDTIAPFSNYGRCVDVLAPGVGIESTMVYIPARGLDALTEGGFSGTSLASPFVAGTAALIKSLRPGWGPDEIISVLRETARGVSLAPPFLEQDGGAGILNAAAAVQRAKELPERFPLHTLHNEAGFAVWQAFNGNLKKKLKHRLPLRRSAIIGWEVFDYDRDREDELLAVSRRGKKGFVNIFNHEGKREARFELPLPLARQGKAKVVPVRPHLDASQLKPGFAVFFPTGEIFAIAVFGADGTPQGVVRTSLSTAKGTEFFDVAWSRSLEQFEVAELAKNKVERFSWKPSGELVAASTQQTPVARARERGITQFYFENFYQFAANDILFAQRRSNPAIAIQTLVGEEREFTPFSLGAKGAVYFDVGDWDLDGEKEIVVATGPGAAPLVRIFDVRGRQEGQFRPTKVDYRGGVEVKLARYREVK